MALINYTGSITLREVLGTDLTYTQLDNNFRFFATGSIIGTYTKQDTHIVNLLQENGDGFGNILEGTVSPTLLSGITASQVVTLEALSPGSPSTQMYFVTASIRNTGSFLGIALETKSPNQPIYILTEGYYSVSSTGYIENGSTVAGTPIFQTGSYVTTTKPVLASATRPLGHVLNTTTQPDIKYIKFSPSTFTLA